MLCIYDAKLKPQEVESALKTEGLGRISHILSAKLTSKVNGDRALDISCEYSELNACLLQPDRLIAYEGQLYRITRPSPEERAGRRIIKVEAPHIIYDLRDGVIHNIETKEDPAYIDGINARQALSQVLEGSNFSVGSVDIDEKLDYLELLEKSKLDGIKQVLDIWGGELEADNFTVNLKRQIGDNRGVRLSLSRNLEGIEVLNDCSNVVTRLWVYGFQGANFKDINGGKAYIDSPNIGKYANIKEGFVYFEEDEEPAVLLEKGKEELAKMDKPLLSVKVNLSKYLMHEAYAELEQVQAGDTVTVTHDFFQEEVPLRALEVEIDCLTGKAASLTLGDIDAESMLFSFSDTVKTAKQLHRSLHRKGGIKAQKVQGILDLMQVKLLASANFQNAEVQENKGILLQNNNESSPDYGAIYMGAGFLAIANSKKPDGSWDWRAFGTGKGFAGSEILAGTITADKLTSTIGSELDISGNETIKQVEIALTPENITQTVRSSKAYLADLEKKAGKQELEDLATHAEVSEAKETAIRQSDESIRLEVTRERQRAEAVEGEIKSFTDTAQTYFEFKVDGLKIGKSGSQFHTLHSDEEVGFYQSGNKVAYIRHNKLYILSAEILEKLIIGNQAVGFTEIFTADGGIRAVYHN